MGQEKKFSVLSTTSGKTRKPVSCISSTTKVPLSRVNPLIDVGWGDAYKRQMEIYQWLFREAGFNVSPIGYFLYVNGIKQGTFYEGTAKGRMWFDTTMIAYEGDASWVASAVDEAVACLAGDEIPDSGDACDNCRYFHERGSLS